MDPAGSWTPPQPACPKCVAPRPHWHRPPRPAVSAARNATLVALVVLMAAVASEWLRRLTVDMAGARERREKVEAEQDRRSRALARAKAQAAREVEEAAAESLTRPRHL